MRTAWLVVLLLVSPLVQAQVILQDGSRDAQGRPVPAADLRTLTLSEDRDHAYVTVWSEAVDQLQSIGGRPSDDWVQVEGGFEVVYGAWNATIHFRATNTELRAWHDGAPIEGLTGHVRSFTIPLAKESFFGETHMWPGTKFQDAWAFVNVTSPVGNSVDPGEGGALNASVIGWFPLDAWTPYGEDFSDSHTPDLYPLDDRVLIAFYQGEKVMAGTWQDGIDVSDRATATGTDTGVAIAGTADWDAVAYYAERESGPLTVSFRDHPQAGDNTTQPLDDLGIDEAEGPWRVPDMAVADGVLYGVFPGKDGMVLARYTDAWELVETYTRTQMARLAAAPSGEVHVLTLSNEEPTAQQVVYHGPNATVEIGTLDRSFDDRMGDEQGGFALAVDALGRPHVAWDDGSTPRMGIIEDGALADVLDIGTCPGGNPCNDMVMAADGAGYVTVSGSYGGFATIWMRTPYGTVIGGTTPPDSNANWNEMALAATPDGTLWSAAVARNALVWSSMEPQHADWMAFSLSSNGTVTPQLPGLNETIEDNATAELQETHSKRSPAAAPWLAIGIVAWVARRRR